MHSLFFFFNDTATTEIYTLSLHDALPIFDKPQSTRVGEPTLLCNHVEWLLALDFGFSPRKRQGWLGRGLCGQGGRRRQSYRLGHQLRCQQGRSFRARSPPRNRYSSRRRHQCQPRWLRRAQGRSGHAHHVWGVATRTTASRFTETLEPFSLSVSDSSVTATNFPTCCFKLDSITSIPWPAFKGFRLDQEPCCV